MACSSAPATGRSRLLLDVDQFLGLHIRMLDTWLDWKLEWKVDTGPAMLSAGAGATGAGAGRGGTVTTTAAARRRLLQALEHRFVDAQVALLRDRGRTARPVAACDRGVRRTAPPPFASAAAIAPAQPPGHDHRCQQQRQQRDRGQREGAFLPRLVQLAAQFVQRAVIAGDQRAQALHVGLQRLDPLQVAQHVLGLGVDRAPERGRLARTCASVLGAAAMPAEDRSCGARSA